MSVAKLVTQPVASCRAEQSRFPSMKLCCPISFLLEKVQQMPSWPGCELFSEHARGVFVQLICIACHLRNQSESVLVPRCAREQRSVDLSMRQGC